MDINKYKNSIDFARNEAIYVLHNVDGTPVTEIALNFNLDPNEVEEIVALHSKYENSLEA